jgi:hypothetical protein
MRTLLVLFVVAMASLAASCATKGGVKTMTYDCSGVGKGWDDCTKQADAQCGAKGYDIVTRKIDSQNTASGTSEMSRVLTVSCK